MPVPKSIYDHMTASTLLGLGTLAGDAPSKEKVPDLYRRLDASLQAHMSACESLAVHGTIGKGDDCKSGEDAKTDWETGKAQLVTLFKEQIDKLDADKDFEQHQHLELTLDELEALGEATSTCITNDPAWLKETAISVLTGGSGNGGEWRTGGKLHSLCNKLRKTDNTALLQTMKPFVTKFQRYIDHAKGVERPFELVTRFDRSVSHHGLSKDEASVFIHASCYAAQKTLDQISAAEPTLRDMLIDIRDLALSIAEATDAQLIAHQANCSTTCEHGPAIYMSDIDYMGMKAKYDWRW